MDNWKKYLKYIKMLNPSEKRKKIVISEIYVIVTKFINTIFKNQFYEENMANGIFALLGVLLGASITEIFKFYHESKRRKENAHFSSILIISTLIKFIEDCEMVVQDDGTDWGRPAGKMVVTKLQPNALKTCFFK